MKISRTASFGIGVIATLLLGTGTAVAATGGTFLLGKSNSASTPTSLTNSSGTALVLNSKSGTPPLKVNNTTKATNLNADQLDGIDSTKFARADVGQTNSIYDTGFPLDVDDDGFNDLLVAVVECPAGTRMTGGGAEDFTDGTTFVNAPLDKTSWWVVSTADPDTTDPTDLAAYALCYNPRGAVSGGEYKIAPTSTDKTEIVRALLAKKMH